MKKDLRDVKREYGYILRWFNGGGDEEGNSWPYRFYLEAVDTKEKTFIEDQAALDLIKEKTVNAFRNDQLYESYAALFQILGIEPNENAPKASEAQKKAAAKYDAANTKQYALKLNLKTDADIIERIQKEGNVQGFIKELIRKEIKKTRE